MKVNLWTRNFSLITVASIIGGAGGIAGGFALSFFVFDQTNSTLASALTMAIGFFPGFLVQFILSPIMDRFSRKTILILGDSISGVIFIMIGIYLTYLPFSYAGYLLISMVLSIISAIDELAFESFYPGLIPKGAERKGYSVSAMVYPVLRVIMLPVAAALLDTIGAAMILIIQGALSFLAAFVESFIKIDEGEKSLKEGYSFIQWKNDVKEGFNYMKKEKGLRNLFYYQALTNGIATGYGPIMIAFFRTTAGLTAAMYSLFSMFEFTGRSLGSVIQYRVDIPKKKKFSLTFFVYLTYEIMDMILLWIPYPLMLFNRACIGFLGSNSAILRQSAVQTYIPENLRARVNAYFSIIVTFGMCFLSLLVGTLGELMEYRQAMTVAAGITFIGIWVFIFRNKREIKKIFEFEGAATT